MTCCRERLKMLQEVPHWLTWPEFSIHQSPVGEMVCLSPMQFSQYAAHGRGACWWVRGCRATCWSCRHSTLRGHDEVRTEVRSCTGPNHRQPQVDRLSALRPERLTFLKVLNDNLSLSSNQEGFGKRDVWTNIREGCPAARFSRGKQILFGGGDIPSVERNQAEHIVSVIGILRFTVLPFTRVAERFDRVGSGFPKIARGRGKHREDADAARAEFRMCHQHVFYQFQVLTGGVQREINICYRGPD